MIGKLHFMGEFGNKHAQKEELLIDSYHYYDDYYL